MGNRSPHSVCEGLIGLVESSLLTVALMHLSKFVQAIFFTSLCNCLLWANHFFNFQVPLILLFSRDSRLRKIRILIFHVWWQISPSVFSFTGAAEDWCSWSHHLTCPPKATLWLCEEAGELRENPCRHEENKPHKKPLEPQGSLLALRQQKFFSEVILERRGQTSYMAGVAVHQVRTLPPGWLTSLLWENAKFEMSCRWDHLQGCILASLRCQCASLRSTLVITVEIWVTLHDKSCDVSDEIHSWPVFFFWSQNSSGTSRHKQTEFLLWCLALEGKQHTVEVLDCWTQQDVWSGYSLQQSNRHLTASKSFLPTDTYGNLLALWWWMQFFLSQSVRGYNVTADWSYAGHARSSDGNLPCSVSIGWKLSC